MGLIGMASLGVLQVTSNTMKASKTSEVGMEVNSTVNSITQNLLNADACKNTFQGIGPINDNVTISDIKNRTGQVLFDKVRKYGNNRLKINELTINGVTIKPPAPGVTNSYGEFKIQIKLEKIGKGYHGTQFVTKTVPLQGEFDPSKNLVKCYSSTEDAVYTAKKQSCDDIGGTWDIAADKCNLSSTKGRSIAASTEYLEDQIQDLKDNYLVNNYVNKAGDTMSGDLTISGKNLSAKDVSATNKVTATSSVCVGSKCRDFSKQECAKGSISLGVNTDGTAICIPLLCQDGYYFEKIDATSGDPVCKLIPTGTCPVDTYVSRVNTDGSVTCSPLPTPANRECPRGMYITRIHSDGNITCSNPNLNSLCTSPHYVAGFDADGRMRCEAPYIPPVLKIRFTCSTTNTSYSGGSDSIHQTASCGGDYFLNSITFRVDGAMEYIKSYKCCHAELYYDPAGPTAPSIQVTDYKLTDPGYQYNSDDQWHVTNCGQGGYFLERIRLYTIHVFDELEDYACEKITFTPPADEAKRLYVSYRSASSPCASGSCDHNDYTIACNSDEFLEYVSFYSAGAFEHLGNYTCGKVELR